MTSKFWNGALKVGGCILGLVGAGLIAGLVKVEDDPTPEAAAETDDVNVIDLPMEDVLNEEVTEE